MADSPIGNPREAAIREALAACDAEIAEWEQAMGAASMGQRHAMRCVRRRIEALLEVETPHGV